ncbi:MAG: transcriptional regulator [Candidatus Woesearchaeota archaeon]
MVDISLYSWVVRGKQRRDLIRYIDESSTPSEIAKKSRYSLNHTSRVLNEFSKKGIARCINPEEKTGRLYELTSQGKELRDKIVKKDSR